MQQDTAGLQAEIETLRARVHHLEHLQSQQSPGATADAASQHRDATELLAALHETTLALMNRLDLDDVLEAIVTHAAHLAGTTHGYLDLLVENETMFEMTVGIGRLAANRGNRIMRDMGLSGMVWRTGEPMMVHNYRSWNERVDKPVAGEFGVVIAAPLRSGATVAGVLGIAYDVEQPTPVKPTVDVLARFAELAAIALDNARLYTAAQQQARELHLMGNVRTALSRELELTAIFRTVVESIAATFGYTQVSGYLRDDDVLVLQHQVGYDHVITRIPVDKGVAGRTARSGKPVLIPDVRTDKEFLGAIEGIVSEICIPLMDQQQVIGILNVESIDETVLTHDDFRIMLDVVEHVNIAIARARLYRELWQRVQQLDALHDTMADITGKLDLEEVLHAIVVRAMALMHADCGELGLFVIEQQCLRVHLSIDMGIDYTGTSITLGEGLMGQVAVTRQPMTVQHYNEWSGRSPHYTDLPPASGLAMPLLAGDELIGVLVIGAWDAERVFSAADIRLLRMFAQQATIAIMNARLFAQVQQLAITDPLMGIYNRRHFFELAQREFERALRHNSRIAIVMADIDNFKQINDRLGHSTGDMALQRVGQIFRQELRSIDILGRYGGEELIVLLPDANCNGVIHAVERLRTALASAPILADQQEIRLTASFGAAVSFHTNVNGIQSLIEYADQSLLQAKRLGKNRLVIWCNQCADAPDECIATFVKSDMIIRLDTTRQ